MWPNALFDQASAHAPASSHPCFAGKKCKFTIPIFSSDIVLCDYCIIFLHAVLLYLKEPNTKYS